MATWIKYLTALLLLICGNILALESSRLVVVRHGEGEHNLLRVFSTWTQAEGGLDHHLTEIGKQQVAKTAQELLKQGFNADTVGLVLVSPLRRTRETAQILIDHGVGSENVLLIDERIREAYARDLEGLPVPILPPNEDLWTGYVNASALHGGETVADVYARMEKIAAELSEWDPAKGHVLLVTHGYPGHVLLQILGEHNSILNTAEARVVLFPQQN